jgi:hypothetical protein
MSERVCLRCDWTGEGDGACPSCGAPLYRLGSPEPVNPRPAEAPSPRHDEGMPAEPLDLLEPPVEPGRRSSVILLVLAFAAVATLVFIGGVE